MLSLPHWERQRWCEQISAINDELNAGAHAELEPDARVDDIPVVDMDEGFFE